MTASHRGRWDFNRATGEREMPLSMDISSWQSLLAAFKTVLASFLHKKAFFLALGEDWEDDDAWDSGLEHQGSVWALGSGLRLLAWHAARLGFLNPNFFIFFFRFQFT